MIYNVVNSVKGGCGKTTLSILMALGLHNKWHTEISPEDFAWAKTNVCLVDVDIQGTALQYLLFGRNGELAPGKLHLNDKVRCLRTDNRKYVMDCIWKQRSGLHDEKNLMLNPAPQFDLVLCDPAQEAKEMFRATSNQNYTPEVQYSTFREGLRDLVLSLGGQNPYAYEHVIFDLPPNSDGYSDAVLDILLNRKYSIMKGKDSCNLFFIQSLDRGQCAATMNHFVSMMQQENFRKASHIFLVYNDTANVGNDAVAIATVMEEASELEASLSLSEEMKNRIYFVTMSFVREYYDLCIQQEGITNKKMEKYNGDNIMLPLTTITCLGKNASGKVCNVKALVDSDKVMKQSSYTKLFEIMEEKV